MDDTKLIRDFPVIVYGNLVKYSETISKARLRVFYRGRNRNGTFITDEFAEKLLSTISYAPVKGIFEDDDFTDHGAERTLGRIYGIVPESHNFAWEKHLDEDGIEREYACVDVLLYTALYEEAQLIPGKAQSMELYAPSIKGNWEFIDGAKLFKFTDASFLGLQVLGDMTEPCFEGAGFFELHTFSKIYDVLCRLETQIEETYNKLPKDEKEGGFLPMEVNFKLSDAQKHDALFSLINESYNEEGGWLITYAICDIYDEYAVCYNYAAQQFERVYYTKDDSTDSVTLGEKVRCFIVDVTEGEKNALSALQALNGGNFEHVDEKYQKIADYEQKIEEKDSLISTLEQEKQNFEADKNTMQETIDSLTAENTSLSEYKKDIEKAEKEKVIDSYVNLLSDEILSEFKEKIDNYTAIELDKELAYSLKQNNMSAFSKNGFEGVIPKDVPLTGIEAILSKY